MYQTLQVDSFNNKLLIQYSKVFEVANCISFLYKPSIVLLSSYNNTIDFVSISSLLL